MAKIISGEEIYFKIEEARLKKFISKKKLAISIGMSPTNFYDTMNLLLKDNIRYNSFRNRFRNKDINFFYFYLTFFTLIYKNYNKNLRLVLIYRRRCGKRRKDIKQS